MSAIVCTLFEGAYHYGVGALANSLYAAGYRGSMWVGYRGALPPWARGAGQGRGCWEVPVASDFKLHFVEMPAGRHLTNQKPEFMLRLWDEHCPEADALFYFDPDITNRGPWRFYEEWVSHGVALCEDVYPVFPADHPWRAAWREFAERNGHPVRRELGRQYSAGFVGLHRRYGRPLLTVWQHLLECCMAEGWVDPNLIRSESVSPYLYDDQQVLNLALMVYTGPMSTVGGEGMDFGRPGKIMSHAAHAASNGKPWGKRAITQALLGVPPSPADKLYWQHTRQPIQLYSRPRYLWRKAALRAAAAIGRFVKRSPASN
ncbi:MAG TPA: hypothetical protein VFJ92_05515 [Gemmatimonadales bacterium]|nr:hypothetical protein [Gemmatimonadales bacterium]